MGSIPDEESSPTISLDEEIDVEDVMQTNIAERAAGEAKVTSRLGSVRPPPATQAASTPAVSIPRPAAVPAAAPPAAAPPTAAPTPAIIERLDATGRMTSPIAELPVIGHYSRFALLGRIAFGGMAEIFLAREGSATGASRHLVIKRILPHVADDEGFVTMFLDEARLAIRLQHPNICPIYEFGEAAGTWFIAMEWVNGVPLGKLIRKARATGGIPVPVTVRVLAQISEALHYAHRARDEKGELLGIVHRDVSPQNIMISYSGSVKLLDFGVAKANSHSAKTQAGVVKGKLAYMAPEQCRGEEIDARADVFALGVCLFEALTGRPLYHRPTEFETLKAVMDDPVPSVRSFKPDIPADLDEIVRHALAKTPEDRWQSAGELQEALEQWLTDHREMMNAARTGQYLETLYADEIARGPNITASTMTQTVGGKESLPAASASAPYARAAGVGPMPFTPHPYTPTPAPLMLRGQLEVPVVAGGEPAKRNKSALPLLIAGLAVLALVLGAASAYGAWVFTRAPVTMRVPPAPTLPTSPIVVVPQPALDAGAAVAALPFGVELEPGANPGSDTPIAPAPQEPVRPRAQGTIAINTRPWSKVYVGSHLLGTTPLGGVSVAAGTVSLRLVDRDGVTHRRTVRVEAGHEATAFFDLTEE